MSISAWLLSKTRRSRSALGLHSKRACQQTRSQTGGSLKEDIQVASALGVIAHVRAPGQLSLESLRVRARLLTLGMSGNCATSSSHQYVRSTAYWLANLR
jgi:hypothetical protein